MHLLLRAAWAAAVVAQCAAARTVRLSNTRLPVDTTGAPLLTGETSVLVHGGVFYLYVNVWLTADGTSCPSVDCCDSPRCVRWLRSSRGSLHACNVVERR